MTSRPSTLLPLDPARVTTIEAYGGTITPLEPLGTQLQGIDLADTEAPPRLG